jgi:2-oxoglutarate dehydrogenase E1 component
VLGDIKLNSGAAFTSMLDIETLRELGLQACRVPGDVDIHPQLARTYAARADAVRAGEGLDWAMGEAIAWARLVSGGIDVRLSGQDVERGTFSHRHCVIFD